MQFVELETARAAKGLRLVVLRSVPSPWSQAAKAILQYKSIDALVVRVRSGDANVTAWTGVPNAPVAMYENEPPRSAWAEILALAERLAPTPRLIPEDGAQRVQMHGLAHELMGQDGVVWNARLLSLDTSFASEGGRGFTLPAARYLAERYAYAPGCAGRARERARQALALLDDKLSSASGSGSYYFGAQITALDFYSSAVLDALLPLPDEQCRIHPELRRGFEAMGEELGDALSPALRAHRDMMHARHVPLPMML